METPEKDFSPEGLQNTEKGKNQPDSYGDAQSPLPEHAVLNEKDLAQLNEIGIALTSEKNFDHLLRTIVKKARNILIADASCLYLLHADKKTGTQQLKFTCASYDCEDLNLFESYIDFHSQTITGHVAVSGLPIRIENIHETSQHPFEFNRTLDTGSFYPFQSVLSYPLINRKAELIGVLEIWNKKKHRKVPITFDNFEEMIIPFTQTDQSILCSVASQATVAIQNTTLYENISDLFEGFIKASVTAIEARDPTTYGHSERVATLSLALCDQLHQLDHGTFRSTYFSKEQLKEIEYAALLHDCGKIGVRESILVKARKLFDAEINQVRNHLDLWKQSKIITYQQKKIDYILEEGKPNQELFQTWESQYLQEFVLADQSYALLLEYNEPSQIPEDDLKVLAFLSQLCFTRPGKQKDTVLPTAQMQKISIKHGSLTKIERKAIESHVTYTYHFLKQIPWITHLQNVPDIAHAHHEKLDGSGYPQGLTEKTIPFPAKIMAVADVFDALVSRDRPYKKAISVKDACNILIAEGAKNKLDAQIIHVFIQKHVYLSTTSKNTT